LNRPKIDKIHNFPIPNIKKEYEEYTKFSGLIDTNTKIRNQASKLAIGENDLFIVASKIAKWIQQDITYDLSTVLENPNQKSTEVFKSKTGVCREITHLYISMLRSLGIPSRVVTGYAYTNSDELVEYLNSNWGGHAWAEVLIGDTWVPFDLTYNQYGYVDASHIILDRTKELRTNSVKINASGFDFKLTPNSLKTTNEFTILEKIKEIEDFGFDIDISGPTELGFDSYGYIETTIKNNKNYYQILFLKIAKPREIDLLSDNEKMLILKPNEELTTYFKYKIPQLDKGYRYTFPFTIYNDELTLNFTVESRETYQYISIEELPEELEQIKSFSNIPVDINCNFNIDLPKNTINCSVKNTNNYEVNDIEFCTNKECQKINLKINELNYAIFNTENFEETITIRNNNTISNKTISIIKPKFEIDTEQYFYT
jgi:hypothetical protein